MKICNYFILVCTFLFCLVPFIVNAQPKAIWDYPVKPGMEEWQKFKSMDEMYQSCQIPENVLKQIDTESLVKICFDFPAYMAMFFSNSPQAGCNVFYSNFNGIRELFKRKDVGQFMLKMYKSMSFTDFSSLWTLEDQGRFVYKYQFFETLLAQPQIIQSLDSNGRKELLKEAIKKFDMKLSKEDLFGGVTFAVNAWIMARTLNFENKLSSKFTNHKDIELSLASGQLVDYDLISIYQQSKTYINEK